MDFLELAKERYSVRKMTDEKIKQEDLNKILEAARLSPTAKNLQRERLLVVNTKDGIEILDDKNIDRFKLVGKTLTIKEIIEKMNDTIYKLR